MVNSVLLMLTVLKYKNVYQYNVYFLIYSV